MLVKNNIALQALVRWVSPEKGIILPGNFIPVLERNGFITKLDEFVWNRAAEDLSNWMKRGYEPVPVSVNVSRSDTNNPKLCDKLYDIVTRNEIPIQFFRLEITESVFVEDTQRLIEVVDRLHALGFLIEMDDFGSGYSSLNFLKDVKVDVLKLDMRFLHGNKNGARGGVIVNAVMRMSRWLKMPVIAEGVESKEQADFLLSLSCQVIQGYLYAKPMPRNEFEEFIKENREKKEYKKNDIKYVLDMKSYWDPESSDSLIFNDYMGAAVLFEVCNGTYEIIRFNKEFLNLLQLKEDYELPAMGLINLKNEDQIQFDEAVKKAEETEKPSKVDVNGISGKNGRIIPLHMILRPVVKSNDRFLLFATLEEMDS